MNGLLRWAWMLLLLVACSNHEIVQESIELLHPFLTPVHYEVKRGDTLFKIARARGVTIDDLRSWNGIDGDEIDVGQVLLIWKSDKHPSPAIVETHHRATRQHRPTLVVAAAVVDTRPLLPKLHPHGVFGAMDEAGLSDEVDPDVKAATARLDRREENTSTTGPWGDRSNALANGGTAEAGANPTAGTVPQGTSFATARVRAPNLPMPPAHRCLSGPSTVHGDQGVAAGKGLSAAQIKVALDRFVRHTAACIPPGSTGTVTVTTTLTVGCNGRVSNAEVYDAGGAPNGVAQCVAVVLSHAPFPAHDLPDGVTFDYPVTLRF